jgi:SRSO17 transposase
MGLAEAKDIESRFDHYVEGLVSVIGHADRAAPLRDYCLGLVMPGERKSVEPMAAITAPERTAAQHQSLLHFIGQGGWFDDAVMGKVREMVLPTIERYGPIEAWIIDDTGFPNASRASAGTAFGWGVAPILWPAWQAGELPGRGDAVGCQPRCEPAGGVSAVFAEGLGRGR